jgi:hypothetical protein
MVILRPFMGVLVALTVTSSVAQSQEKAPKRAWDWTLDERIAQRFDPDRIRERTEAYEESIKQLRARSRTAAFDAEADDSKPRYRYLIDGKRNPELFLPHELFDMLLSGLTADESLRSKQQAFYRAWLRSFGYDDVAFWNALASVSGEYLVIRFGPPQLGFGSNESATVAQDSLCNARLKALESARRLFGRKKFDWMLYAVVAPTAWKSEAGFLPHPEVRLKQEEECH